jgi:hypothetical protein
MLTAPAGNVWGGGKRTGVGVAVRIGIGVPVGGIRITSVAVGGGASSVTIGSGDCVRISCVQAETSITVRSKRRFIIFDPIFEMINFTSRI